MDFLKKILYHQNFGVIAGTIGIITGVFGVYAYFASIKEPNLTYYFSPTRTPIVQKGNLENFSVTFQGTPIKGDLSTAEIQIWNQGKQPIHREDILKPITLSTPNGEVIYQTTVATTRDVIGFNWLTSSNQQSGVLQMDWKILEQNDGIKLQIIYGGNINLPLILDGVIVGQQHLTLYQKGEKSLPYKVLKTIYLIVAILFIFVLLNRFEKIPNFLTIKVAKTRITIPSTIIALPSLFLLGYVYSLFLYYLETPLKPPFGF